MRNILALIQRFYVVILFMALEVFSLIVLFSSNNFHRSAFIQHSSDLVGTVYSKRSQLSQYLRLGEINDQLALENARLRSRLAENYLVVDGATHLLNDTIRKQRYQFRTARVINATVTRDMNYLTLDRGRKQGIANDMGVISGGSIIGVVTSTSDNFSIVMPLIHSNFQSPVQLNGFYGQLTWPGGDPERARIDDIPKHARVTPGDTVITTGYSFAFPQGELVGFVEEVDDEDKESFHVVTVRLATDFRKLNYVEVVTDLFRNEIDSLQKAQIQSDGANDH
jgi:rod shape-determining protein MreC